MNNKTADIYAALSASPTLAQIRVLRGMMNIDISNQDQVKGAFAASGLSLITALDHGLIEFKDDLSRAHLLGLLAIAIDYLLDGSLKDPVIINFH